MNIDPRIAFGGAAVAALAFGSPWAASLFAAFFVVSLLGRWS